MKLDDNQVSLLSWYIFGWSTWKICWDKTYKLTKIGKIIFPFEAESVISSPHIRKNPSSVTHEWFSLILSFITLGSTLWRSLVVNQICMTSVTSSYPMKLGVMYVCCSSVSGSPSKFCSDEIWLVYMVHAYF